MKGCFVLQRRFAYIAHDIIVHLNKKYGLTQFCGYVFLRSTYEFLKTQKEINYTSLILDEDIHNRYKNEVIDMKFLSHLEKEYGVPNLWPYLAVDRIIMNDQIVREYPHSTSRYSHEDMLKILEKCGDQAAEVFDRATQCRIRTRFAPSVYRCREARLFLWRHYESRQRSNGRLVR